MGYQVASGMLFDDVEGGVCRLAEGLAGDSHDYVGIAGNVLQEAMEGASHAVQYAIAASYATV